MVKTALAAHRQLIMFGAIAGISAAKVLRLRRGEKLGLMAIAR